MLKDDSFTLLLRNTFYIIEGNDHVITEKSITEKCETLTL